MPTAISVLGVHTNDATPTVSKFKVSAVAGFDVATATVKVESSGAPITAYRLVTGASRNLGKVFSLGVVCGLDRCGAPGARILRVPDGTVFVSDVAEQKIGGADRDVPINIYALIEPGGWVT